MKWHWIVVIFVSVIILGTLSFSAINAQVQYSIPSWVKGVAGFWAEDKITDSDFGEGLSFLINEGIIKIPEMELLKQRVVELEGEIARFNDDDNDDDNGDDTTPSAGCGPNEIRDVTGECVNAFDNDVKSTLSVKTDQSSYSDGDTMKISGRVSVINKDFPNQSVSLRINDPIGNIVTISGEILDASGQFFHNLTTGGSLWKLSGDYEVRAQYGAQKASTTFSFTASPFIPEPPPPPEPEPEPNPEPEP